MAFDVGAEDTGGSPRRTIAGRARVEEPDAHAGRRQLPGNGRADDAGADDD